MILLGQLSSALVHEVNNHLGSLVNNAEVLAEDHALLSEDPAAILRSDVRSRLAQCTSDVQSIAHLMGELTHFHLQLARRSERTPVNINALLTDIIRYLRPLSPKTLLTMQLDKNMPMTTTNPVHVEQTVVNLVLNALQHSLPCRAKAHVTLSSEFSSIPGDRYPIRIRCIDDGCGIHVQHQDRIFDFGFTTRSEGTGLGLFIARKLIEDLGGRVTLEDSVMFGGTTFAVQLPLILPATEATSNGE
jgi:signal transduction histidine kinase